MGQKGNLGKARSIRFPIWMSDALEDIANHKGMTFTDLVVELLRQELAVMDITMGSCLGIGRESVESKKPMSATGTDG